MQRQLKEHELRKVDCDCFIRQAGDEPSCEPRLIDTALEHPYIDENRDPHTNPLNWGSCHPDPEDRTC